MDLLQSIGKTPLIRLAKLTAGLDAEILVKVESRNPGGSIKDRAALRMIQGALEKGTLKPNGTIVEPTSGNTDIIRFPRTMGRFGKVSRWTAPTEAISARTLQAARIGLPGSLPIKYGQTAATRF